MANIGAKLMIAQPPSGKPTVRVIVRAFGDEPVRLIAGVRYGAYVIVMNADMDAAIGFPLSRVYRDDEDTFRALERAHKAGDGQALTHIWKAAERYVP